MYESNFDIRDLLAEYGGWDKSAILSQIPESSPYQPQDVALWLIIFLYSEFSSGLHHLGLGLEWHQLQQSLEQSGWANSDVNLLIKGNRFSEFSKYRPPKNANSPDYWKYFQPDYTAGWTGWLGLNDIENLLSKLSAGEQNLLSLAEVMVETDSLSVKQAYLSAKDMLTTARQHNLDLCLILSG